MKTLTIVFLSILAVLSLRGQPTTLVITPGIILPKDSVIKNQLIADLKGFLDKKEQPNHENTFVLKKYLPETSLLLDEFKEIEKSKGHPSTDFYKANLINVRRMNDSTYKIQLAYLGVKDSTSSLRAVFSILARSIDHRFYFFSPLKEDTKTWNSQRFGNMTLYYPNKLNVKAAKKFINMIETYDRKLNAPPMPSEFYCCANFDEVLGLAGVDYKSDYNGRNFGSLTAKENGMSLIVNGEFTPEFSEFDPHDLWHSRLHIVLSPSVINRPVDEGTAYLYGGSWGLTWSQILERFRNYAAKNPGADWLAQYNESKIFDEAGRYPLNVDFVINALIIRQLEKEKGFDKVMELLSCGKKQKDNANYFLALEKITGIKKDNFNTAVQGMIR